MLGLVEIFDFIILTMLSMFPYTYTLFVGMKLWYEFKSLGMVKPFSPTSKLSNLGIKYDWWSMFPRSLSKHGLIL